MLRILSISLRSATFGVSAALICMDGSSLRSDCSRCTGLCCAALAFDRSAEFAIDKPAGVACPHLRSDHRCRIHGQLAQRGFSGCTRYDCLGAGQRVATELFPGRSWRESPAVAARIFDAFRALRSVHALSLLLVTAATLPLEPHQERRRRELITALQPEGGWTEASLTRFEQGLLPAEVAEFLRSLRATATRALENDSARARRRALPMYR